MSDDLVFHVLNLSLFLVATGFLLTTGVFRSLGPERAVENPRPELARKIRY